MILIILPHKSDKTRVLSVPCELLHPMVYSEFRKILGFLGVRERKYNSLEDMREYWRK